MTYVNKSDIKIFTFLFKVFVFELGQFQLANATISPPCAMIFLLHVHVLLMIAFFAFLNCFLSSCGLLLSFGGY